MGCGSSRRLTMRDVAKHNKPNDCWIIIHGRVYNCTKYGKKHPGGDRCFHRVAGTDATSNYLDAPHTQRADDLLGRYCVGYVPALMPNKNKKMNTIVNKRKRRPPPPLERKKWYACCS